MSELLQNIDAVLGITMSILAILGFGRLMGPGNAAPAPAAAPAEVAQRPPARRRSFLGKLLWFVLLAGMVVAGAYMTLKWVGGHGYSRGGYDHWRGDSFDGNRNRRIRRERQRNW